MKKKNGQVLICPHCGAKLRDVLIFSRFCQTGTLSFNEKGRPFYTDLERLDHIETQDVKCPDCMGDLIEIVGEGEAMDDEHYIPDMRHKYTVYNVAGTVVYVEIQGLIDVNKAKELLGDTVGTHYDSECGMTWFFVDQIAAKSHGVPKNGTYPWFYGTVIEGRGQEPFVKGLNVA